MPKSLLLRYAREVYDHAGALYGGLFVTILLGVVGRFSSWHPDSWMYVAAISLGLVVAQYRAWKAMHRELRSQVAINYQISKTATFDLRFGPNSAGNPKDRLESAIALFEKLESEVLADDFSNAGDLLIFKDFFLQLLRDWFASGAAYHHWHERLFKVVDAVNRHERELAEREVL